LFQHCRGLARAMIIEAVGFDAAFAEKRNEIFNQSYERIVKTFIGMKKSGTITNYDPWVATLLCSGTLYSIVDEWLQSELKTNLVDYAFPVIVFNLNAFGINYNDTEVKQYISEMLSDIESNYHDLISFRLNLGDEQDEKKICC